MSVFCFHCEKLFSTQSNLNRHIREVHLEENSDLTSSHSYETHNFKCLEGCQISFRQFEDWLSKIELENSIQYCRSTGVKRNLENIELFYYQCNRSGKQKIIPDRKKQRSKKVQGNAKLDFACTSQIILTKLESGELIAEYFKNHYGHDFDLKHIHLCENLHRTVASKHILTTVRQQTGDSLESDDLLIMKDLSNIETSFHISLKDGQRHKDDLTSVDLYLQECQELGDHNPILFYKKQGEPMSGKYKAVGIDINTNTFTSDITTVYYNAWISIMGPVGVHLYCSWHIDRAWQQNITKVKDPEKRSWVYKSLKHLQTILREKDFERDFQTFLNMLLSEESTREFYNYLKNNYFCNRKQWAFCYSKDRGINMNTFLENMHEKNNERSYFIKRKNGIDICCGLMCSHCNICWHTFNCTCLDYQIKNMICKHIHCIRMKELEHSKSISSYHSKPKQSEEIDMLVGNMNKAPSSTSSLSQSVEDLKKKKMLLRNAALKLVADIDRLSYSSEDMDFMLKNLRVLNSLGKITSEVSGTKNHSLKTESSQPVNKKIEKQKIFFSTKKKKKMKSNISKASLEEEEIIEETLTNSKNNDHDHNYNLKK
ncbi:hypothetical protein KPH14_007655 [Odynerus spinipes]|uniref:C2H2-type domain-containing protein n=1 Tax=Odynerus spinipes TaxID=1348599 RepID=A0AAD9RF46_9HYME|nr:hypothetical protein KPH14_007655 [Odynerus spinipes]